MKLRIIGILMLAVLGFVACSEPQPTPTPTPQPGFMQSLKAKILGEQESRQQAIDKMMAAATEFRECYLRNPGLQDFVLDLSSASSGVGDTFKWLIVAGIMSSETLFNFSIKQAGGDDPDKMRDQMEDLVAFCAVYEERTRRDAIEGGR